MKVQTEAACLQVSPIKMPLTARVPVCGGLTTTRLPKPCKGASNMSACKLNVQRTFCNPLGFRTRMLRYQSWLFSRLLCTVVQDWIRLLSVRFCRRRVWCSGRPVASDVSCCASQAWMAAVSYEWPSAQMLGSHMTSCKHASLVSNVAPAARDECRCCKTEDRGCARVSAVCCVDACCTQTTGIDSRSNQRRAGHAMEQAAEPNKNIVCVCRTHNSPSSSTAGATLAAVAIFKSQQCHATASASPARSLRQSWHSGSCLDPRRPDKCPTVISDSASSK